MGDRTRVRRPDHGFECEMAGGARGLAGMRHAFSGWLDAGEPETAELVLAAVGAGVGRVGPPGA